jgi:5-methylcytosine-specific restriction endonuclease McrA
MRSTAQWKRTRLYILQRDPVCITPGCNNPSTEVDHKIRASVWVSQGNNYYDDSNLQGLCHRCHSSKTSSEVGWAGNNKITGV